MSRRITSVLFLSFLLVSAAGLAEPSKDFSFTLQIPEVINGTFHSVTGLDSELEIVEFRDGSDPAGVVRKIPGVRKYGNITLKRGVTSDKSLWLWKQAVDAGPSARVNAWCSCWSTSSTLRAISWPRSKRSRAPESGKAASSRSAVAASTKLPV